MKVPGCTSGPTLCRRSLLYTKLSAVLVMKLRVKCGSKCGGSQPRARRMPPRLGGPASAPQSAGGLGKTDSVAPAARPACSRARRLTRGSDCRVGYDVTMGNLPEKYTRGRLRLHAEARAISRAQTPGPAHRRGLQSLWYCLPAALTYRNAEGRDESGRGRDSS